MAVYGYVRVSCEDPNKPKFSPEAQRRNVSEEAAKNNLKVDEFFEDLNVNSASMDKGRWENLASLLKTGDTLICNDFTRLGRSTIDTLTRIKELITRDVTILGSGLPFDPNEAEGEFMLTVMSGVAQLDNQMRARKVREAQVPMAESGKWKGGPLPYGYRYGEGFTVEIEPYESEIVKMIFELRSEGYGYVGIARILEEREIPSREGVFITNVMVKRILNNRKYICEREFRGNIYPLDFPPIVSRELFESCRDEATG